MGTPMFPRSILFIILLLSLVPACTLNPLYTVAMAKSQKQSIVNDSMKIPQEFSGNILEIVAEVGKSQGYRENRLGGDNLYLERTASDLQIMTTMLANAEWISVSRQGDMLFIQVNVSGVMGKGDKEYAEEVLNIFKKNLLQRLQARGGA